MSIPLNIDWQQILLHLFNFGILAGGLYLLLYKPVKQFMEKREAHYRELDAAANRKAQEAQALEQQYQEKLAQADEEILQKRAEAQQAIQQSTQQQLEQARAEASRIVSEAHTAAERSRERALADAQKELQELAAAAAEKLVLQSEGEAFEQFLELTERGTEHEQH